MSYTTLPKSGLRINNPVNSNTNWSVDVFDYNMTRLNTYLLKLSALLDVNVAGISNGDVLKYNAGTTMWVKYTPDVLPS